MNKSDTILIVGRSEFVTPKLLEKIKALPFDKVAINHYIEGAKYVAFVDKKVASDSDKDMVDAIPLTLKEFNYPNAEAYHLVSYNGQFLVKDDTLAYFGFTHDFVLSWCIKQGYSNVILIGVADFETHNHYDKDEDFNPSPRCIAGSKNAIENIYSKELKIFTMNKKSILQVPRITIEELKK